MGKISKKNKDRFYQVAIIKLSDGSTIRFTGRAELYPGDVRKIVNISFTEPMKMDDDCHWGEINVQNK